MEVVDFPSTINGQRSDFRLDFRKLRANQIKGQCAKYLTNKGDGWPTWRSCGGKLILEAAVAPTISDCTVRAHTEQFKSGRPGQQVNES